MSGLFYRNFQVVDLKSLQYASSSTSSEIRERLLPAEREAEMMNGYLRGMMIMTIEAEMAKIAVLKPFIFEGIDLRQDPIMGAWRVFLAAVFALLNLLDVESKPIVVDQLRDIYCLFESTSEFREFRNFELNVSAGKLDQVLIDLRRILQIAYVKLLGPTRIFPKVYCNWGKNCKQLERCVFLHVVD